MFLPQSVNLSSIIYFVLYLLELNSNHWQDADKIILFNKRFTLPRWRFICVEKHYKITKKDSHAELSRSYSHKPR